MGIPIFDFHVHGGDVKRTEEIRQYATLEGLSGLVLLSLPIAGLQKMTMCASMPHFNMEVLESKKLLLDQGIPVWAFGSLDNRARLSDLSHGTNWNPAAQVEALAHAGFDGLKLWEGKPELAKILNLRTDDAQLVEACQEAGRHQMPVLFHVADPPEFFSDGSGQPSFRTLIEGAIRMCQKAPDTTFVFPHLAFLAGDLKYAAFFLNELPNAYFDLAPGNYFYSLLASNRDAARTFFCTFWDRILFGSDSFFFDLNQHTLPGDSLEGNQKRCRRLHQFLSGDSSQIIDNPYILNQKHIPQVSCLGLPEDVLDAVFSGNARRILVMKTTVN